MAENIKPSNNNLTIDETYSIGGVLLCYDEIYKFLTGELGEKSAAYVLFCILIENISFIQSGIFEDLLFSEIFLDPDSFDGKIIIERYLEINKEFGVDNGWSPDYEILTGAYWWNIHWIERPRYDLSYALAMLNATWLLYQQETNGTGREIYANMIKSPIKENLPYVERCTSLGLPDFTDPASFEGLDEFLYSKAMGLYDTMNSD